ncbi:hypothetical protein SAMN04488112_108167 [Melghirimyces thermohalophilus]|uniref:Uncharacterized protein n=1 Tax=Melghirimyces thermohalophilus TaxID=1236220 RepID=A0A1G6LXA2_9BACL|nr:hypothetical protein [Melghirimyces thermohalophilus]SDC47850.1 hypothetical protein SAMN04488112_108167 [Melghirimyces thermohalophilus]
MKAIFGQYYFWRNTLHRWFGLCIAKSPDYGKETDDATTAALKSLTDHILVDVVSHFDMYKEFLDDIQVDTKSLVPNPITTEYNDSFFIRFRDRSFEEATSALAGRELLSSIRSNIISESLINQYNFNKVKFWRAHEEPEEEHFRSMWNALTQSYTNFEDLEKAAREEISEHVRYWVAFTVLKTD